MDMKKRMMLSPEAEAMYAYGTSDPFVKELIECHRPDPANTKRRHGGEPTLTEEEIKTKDLMVERILQEHHDR